MKFYLLGSISITRKLENQSQNPYWAIGLPAISLGLQALTEIWCNLPILLRVTKMEITSSKMDGFSILKIVLADITQDYNIRH